MNEASGRTGQSRPLRISYILPQFPVPTEVFAISDINALRDLGHEVTVHTIKPRPKDVSARLRLCGVPDDLPIFRPNLSGALGWPKSLWHSRKQARLMARRILASAPSAPRTALSALLCIPRVLEILEETRSSDIVHVFWSRHPGLVLAALESSDSRALRSAFVGAYDLVADDFLVEVTLGSAETVFSHAEANRAYARAKAPAPVPVHIVHRGIPLSPLGSEAERDRYRWITASALVQEKNVEAVIRLFAAARALEPRLTMLIFGDGPDRDRLQAIIEDLNCSKAISMMGHAPRHDLFEQLQRSSTFLLLSKKPSERLPNVVKEALWAGCSIISSKSEGIEELIPDPSIGFVVDPDDPEMGLAAVKTLLAESSSAADARRDKARAIIQGSFSSEGSMRRYVDSWRLALASREGMSPVKLGRGAGPSQSSA